LSLYRSLTEVDRKDQSETNSKLKGPIWNLKNLKDLSKTNSKLKWPNWNLKNLKDLSKTNIKLKRPGEVFDLNFNTHLVWVRNHVKLRLIFSIIYLAFSNGMFKWSIEKQHKKNSKLRSKSALVSKCKNVGIFLVDKEF